MSFMSSSTIDRPDREIVLKRILNAHRELVFDVWTNPEHVGQWWGPNGLPITTLEMSALPGGEWTFVTHGRDGIDYQNRIVFHEVSRPERLTYAHEGEDPKQTVQYQATVSFEDLGMSKTKVTLRAVFPTAADRAYVVREHRAIRGTRQMLARLAAHVEALIADTNEQSSDPAREIHSTRVFQAPRELVWRAWTEPEHLAQWWGPKGFRNTFQEFDFRPGGHWRFVMHGPDGQDYKNESVFVEITEPERIVFDHISGHFFRVVATFTEEAPNQTRISFRMIFRSAAECDRIRPIAQPGNEQNFDRLAAELERMA